MTKILMAPKADGPAKLRPWPELHLLMSQSPELRLALHECARRLLKALDAAISGGAPAVQQTAGLRTAVNAEAEAAANAAAAAWIQVSCAASDGLFNFANWSYWLDSACGILVATYITSMQSFPIEQYPDIVHDGCCKKRRARAGSGGACLVHLIDLPSGLPGSCAELR